MRLLIITQKVDHDDPILGFFHGWVEKLSKDFSSVTVVCLGKGSYNLPDNVKVFSLGKEKGVNKIKYISNFYRYILGLKYDAVFVHMNQEYILLGGWLWKLTRKAVYFWRNHPKGSILTRIAVWLSNKVFYTSPFSFTARFAKSIIMPVGIDTDLFKPRNSYSIIHNSILMLGRVSPLKNIHLMIEVAKILKSRGINFTLDIVGDPVNPEDFEYKQKLLKEGVGNFLPGVPNGQTPEIYANHEIYVNLTPSGSMDKTIFEAVARGCMPVVVNDSFKKIFNEKMLASPEGEDVARKIEYWLRAGEDEKNEWSKKLRNYVLENHSLDALIDKLCIVIKR